MARKPTGTVLELRRTGGRRVYALRFRAHGRRRYLTLGTSDDGWTRPRAEEALQDMLSDVRRGTWQPPAPESVQEEPTPEPTFHEFASEWLTMRKQENLSPRTIEDYEWALSYHLLPFFKDHRLSGITIREVDRYKTAKAGEGCLSPRIVNKTLTRLSQVLSLAVEYDLIGANPAAGRRRRLKVTPARRPFVEPEQLMALLAAADEKPALYGGKGRAMLAVLAGTGLRISEALALRRRSVDLVRGTLEVEASKTPTGRRVIDLPPALRDELALYLAGSPRREPDALVFPTKTGRMDNRNNVRRRLIVKAVKRANVKLAEQGIAPIGRISPHALRRTYASLRCAVGDDPAYTAEQLGHVDARFTLSVYTGAVKRPQRLSGAELQAFDAAIEWAQWALSGTSDEMEPVSVVTPVNGEHAKRAS
jgi:integrase